MKLIHCLIAVAVALPAVPAWAQQLEVSPDGRRIITPPRTPRERDLGLEGRPPGAVERPAPDDSYSTEEPDDDDDDDLDDPDDAPPAAGRL